MSGGGIDDLGKSRNKSSFHFAANTIDCDNRVAAMTMPFTELISGVSPLVVMGVVLCSYILGCISTGYYLVRLRTGQDVRDLGSGSTGARNVGRVLGGPGFFLTMMGDLIKGGLAVWLAQAITGNDRVAMLAWLAVVAGHVWPVQLGFRGGKGVSTSLMGLLVYDWRLVVVFSVVFVAGMVATRRSVAASLVAYALLPGACCWLGGDQPKIWGVSALAGLVILAHHRNLIEEIAEAWARREAGPESDQSVKEL